MKDEEKIKRAFNKAFNGFSKEIIEQNPNKTRYEFNELDRTEFLNDVIKGMNFLIQTARRETAEEILNQMYRRDGDIVSTPAYYRLTESEWLSLRKKWTGE